MRILVAILLVVGLAGCAASENLGWRNMAHETRRTPEAAPPAEGVADAPGSRAKGSERLPPSRLEEDLGRLQRDGLMNQRNVDDDHLSGFVIPERDTGRIIYDLAEVLDPSSEDQMRELTSPLAQAGRPIVVLTIKRLADYHVDPDKLASFATAVYNSWGIGSRAYGNVGALILLSKEDRRMRIAVGEGVTQERIDQLPSIIAEIMTPKFKEGDYARGLLEGVRAIRDRVINP